jgi:hypothetical protein
MASYNKHNAFVENLAEKFHNLQSDTLKVALLNTANSIFGDLTEISAGNGYTAGGTQSTQSSSAQSSGTYKLVIGDVTFTASGGSIGPFRYADLYSDTPTSPADPLICFWDYGTSLTLTAGNSFTVDFDASAGVLQIA